MRGMDVWVRDLQRGGDTRLTAEGTNFVPLWTSDGASVTFTSDRSGDWDLYSRRVDLSESADLLVDVPETMNPGFWSPDGRTLVYHVVDPDTQRDLWVRGADREVSPFLVTAFNELSPRLSPDGRGSRLVT